jgi:chemotaxis protein methyltransferase CheR
MPLLEPAFELTDRDFARVRRLILDYAGISLSEQKRTMVYNRLVRRLRSRGEAGFGRYLDVVQSEDPVEREAFINALTTNLTAFFREPHHFELLAARAAATTHTAAPMRIWSSGCSTGEEAWSIAMVLREAGRRAEILATDIDSDVLATAEAGVYPAERTGTMPPRRVQQHFLRGVGANAGLLRVRPELRAMVRFGQLNLQAPQWALEDGFDAIFCRNVVIYFDREAQRRLASRFAAMLAPGGLLVVGHAESFPSAHPAFRSCGRTAYELRTAGPAA